MELENTRSEDEILQDIEELCKSEGYAHALAVLCVEANYVKKEVYLDPEKRMKLHNEAILRPEADMLMGHMIKTGLENFLARVSGKQIQYYVKKSKDLLNEWHDFILRKNNNEMAVNNAIANLEMYKAVLFNKGLKESLFYGAETAHELQYDGFTIQKYKNDKKWLIQERGFSAENAGKVIKAMSEIQYDYINDLFAIVDDEASQEEHIITLIKILKETNFPDSDIYMDNEDFSYLHHLGIRKQDIIKKAKLSEDIVENVLSAFSINNFPCNDGYKEHGDVNQASMRPILKINDDGYILFDRVCLKKSFYESPAYWMQNSSYKEQGNINRAKFAEETCASFLKDIFGASNVYENVKIYKDDNKKNEAGEIDVLVIHADRAIVVEVKSKKMTLEAIKGSQDKIEDDFKKSIQKACNQSYKCAELLLNSECRFESKNNKKVKINRDLNEIFTMCITAGTYPALDIQKFLLLESKEHPIIRRPYVTDIFIFDTLCEFLDNPAYFLDYQHKRAKYSNKIPISDELSILGFHLSNNLYLEDGDVFYMLEDLRFPVEESFTARRDNRNPGEQTPKGILTAFKGTYFEKIVKNLGKVKQKYAIELAYLLLNLNQETVNELQKGLDRMFKRVRETGTVADFIFNFDEVGIAFYANPDDIEDTKEMLTEQCRKLKNERGAEIWFYLILKHSYDAEKPIIFVTAV